MTQESVLPAKYQNFTQLPGPRRWPLLGNLLQLDSKKLHLVFEQWAEKFGPLYQFKLFRKQVLAVSDPDLINEVLCKRPEYYRRLSNIDTVLKELGVHGVFSAEGEDWKRQRKLVMRALNKEHLRHFFPTFIKVTERLKKRWEKLSAQAQAIEVQKELTRYTVDVTSNLAFGYDVNTIEQEGDIIQQHLEKIFPIINHRINTPFPYWRFLKLPADRALEDSIKVICDFIMEVISRCKKKLSQNPELIERPSNFLEAMLAAQEAEDIDFSEEEVMGNVITILLAGEDTTSNTMAWIMYFMTEYPEVQRKMQEESEQVLGEGQVLANYEDLSRLSYIEAVAQETLRLKSVAPINYLETNKDVRLGDIEIPQGTGVVLLTRYCSSQDSAFSAAKEFQPERWLKHGKGSCPGHNTDAFLPFGGGPRFCPGHSLAFLEIKMVLAMFCRNFQVSKYKDHKPPQEQFSFTMMPADLWVNFSKRH